MTVQTRLPISVAKPQALTQGNDRPETPCATDLHNRRATAALEGRNHITPTPYDILHDYISGPVFNRAKTEAKSLCGQCPIAGRCLSENRDEVWAQAILGIDNRTTPTTREICGTFRGYKYHLRYNEVACDECKDANNQRTKERKAAIREGRTPSTKMEALLIGRRAYSEALAERNEARAEELHRFVDQGAGLSEVLRAFDLTRGALHKWCTRHDHLDLYRAVVAPEKMPPANQHTRRGAA